MNEAALDGCEFDGRPDGHVKAFPSQGQDCAWAYVYGVDLHIRGVGVDCAAGLRCLLVLGGCAR